MNSDQIRIKPEIKAEIYRLRKEYAQQIIEEGKQTITIGKVMGEGLSYGDFIEIILNYWKERETKKK